LQSSSRTFETGIVVDGPAAIKELPQKGIHERQPSREASDRPPEDGLIPTFIINYRQKPVTFTY